MNKNFGHKIIKFAIVLVLMFFCMTGMVQYKRNRSDLKNNQQQYSVTFSITNNSDEETLAWGLIFSQKALEVIDEFRISNEKMEAVTTSCSSTFSVSGCTIKFVLTADSENEEFKMVLQEFDTYITEEIRVLAESKMGYFKKKSEMDYRISPRLKSSDAKYGILGALMGLCFGLVIVSLGELYFEKRERKPYKEEY